MCIFSMLPRLPLQDTPLRLRRSQDRMPLTSADRARVC